MRIQKEVQAAGGFFALCSPQLIVREIIQLFKLMEFLHVCQDEAEAVADMERRRKTTAAHLRKLSGDKVFPFRRNRSFTDEVLWLRDAGFIEHCSDASKNVQDLPQDGDDLRQFFQATERGREYLKLQADSMDETDDGEQTMVSVPGLPL